jgi:iron complex outermembrane receptor protein
MNLTTLGNRYGSPLATKLISCLVVGQFLVGGPIVAAAELEEVVVTARKRAESLQDVPVAVTSIGAAAVERQQFSSLRDVNFSVPNLSAFNNQTTVISSATFIRGVGQDDSTPVQEQGVATYLDDVYLPRAQGGLFDLLDFERIEVLRGPQGTLYGRNSSGGALKFVTRAPSLDEARLLAQATFGRYDRRDFGLSGSVPLVEGVVGVKADFVSRERDGYVTQESTGNDVSRVDRQTGRIGLLWEASEALRVDWSADATRDRSGLQGGTPIQPNPNGSLPRGYGPIYGDLFVTGADVPDLNEFDGEGTALTVTYDFGPVQLKSVSAYRTWETEFWSDLGGRPGNLDLFSDLDGRTLTQEFQIASSGEGKLNWVAGVFYMDERLDVLNEFLFLHDYVQDTESSAIYAEATYSLTERLRVTVGGRYTEDDKEIDMDAIGLGGAFSVEGETISFNEFTPKLAVDYSVSDNLLIYASAQDGYKAGAFQGFPQQLTDLTEEELQPEIVTAYEIGAKSTWLDGGLVFNAAAFFSDYEDKQLNIFNPATLGFVSRTAKAEMYGFEVEWTWRATGNLTVTGFVATFEGEIKDPDPTDPLVPPDGTKIAFMPDVSAKLGLEWVRPLDNAGELFVGGNLSHVGEIDFAVFNDPVARMPSYELIDARLGYRTADGRFEISAGGRNLADEEYVYTAAVVDGGTLWMGEPRTWAITLRYQLTQ